MENLNLLAEMGALPRFFRRNKKLRAGKPAQSTRHHQLVDGNLTLLFYDQVGSLSIPLELARSGAEQEC